MSTSSNECKYDHLQYCGGWANEMESPWYPTFGQPLIYYSQVQPFKRRQRGKEAVTDKPNCFKKAFQWYTQEHVPFKNGRGRSDLSSNMNKTDVKGFAAWLDEKYNEFLQTSLNERTCKYILTQTSADEMDKVTNCEQFAQPMTKKYKRVKSPWKKRKKYLNAKEKGDVLMKSNQSIEIILKPKDLSRPESESCQRAKAQSCCNRSSSIVESNASTHRIAKQKSRSLTSFKEREIHMIPFGIPDYYAKKEEREYEKSSNHKVAKKDSRLKKIKHRSRHVSCQCSKYAKFDAYSQVEDRGIKESDPCPCKLNNPQILSPLDTHNSETKQELVTSETNMNDIKPNIAPKYVLQTQETRFTAPSTSAAQDTDAFLAPVSDSVQTSNYSINLKQNTFPEYPLFMKIICADKLNEIYQ